MAKKQQKRYSGVTASGQLTVTLMYVCLEHLSQTTINKLHVTVRVSQPTDIF